MHGYECEYGSIMWLLLILVYGDILSFAFQPGVPGHLIFDASILTLNALCSYFLAFVSFSCFAFPRTLTRYD
jgi:hypothetical protein